MRRAGLYLAVVALCGVLAGLGLGLATPRVKAPPAGMYGWDWQIGAQQAGLVSVPRGIKLIDLDGFETSAATVTRLKKQGLYVVCYINAGSYEPYRPDSARYPARLKLGVDPNWKDEAFVDIRDVFRPKSVLADVLRKRLKMCRDKGFAAVEPDNLQNDENAPGGVITLQNQVDFNGWLADEAHALGLAIFQKNGPDKVLLRDRTGKRLVDKFDGILNESCHEFDECGPLAEYVGRGKPALNVEYKEKFLNCAGARRLGINSMFKDLYLRGAREAEYRRVAC
ncbi:endo alpha-1,4 polygalactosaminidase [Deinococcus arenicola]|uniref:Endo alpha-1,4 polygalactosaminidase n=1 Tax=Deinococcus arenicola TaxID=2994950 RepID=A0ABU4DMG8_9DEIO|nr:endo alpha-1,4 polygalactosaminidase [Deinococcus sp. ZS9-10]MDV6373630.1 endo alpha-1,4 polygalactosaminidase [Deinococcus sp. ZS9-10]